MHNYLYVYIDDFLVGIKLMTYIIIFEVMFELLMSIKSLLLCRLVRGDGRIY